jgi:hypothetical protein
MDEMHFNDFDLIMDRDIEVDYDLNPTQLYLYISDSDWHETLHAMNENPIQARIWVVKTENRYARDESTCRFLPIHSACARAPPISIVSALLEAYPEGASKQDDNGMYPLHYACANQASADVIELLLNYYPEARFQRVEVSGALPIHLAAQWGVSSIAVMQHMLRDNGSLASARDSEGLSPLEIAIEADYQDHKVEIINILRDAILQETLEYSSTLSSVNVMSFTDQSNIIELGGESRDNQSQYSKRKRRHFAKRTEILKKEVSRLKDKKKFLKSSARKQIEMEWEAVNTALSEMDEKLMALQRTQLQDQEKRDPHDDGNDDPFQEDSPEEKTTEEKHSEIEDIVAENIKMEEELFKLEDTQDAYMFKVETVENIVKELVTTITQIAEGHNATMQRMQQMEAQMIKMSEARSMKLKELTSEVDAIALKISNSESSHEGKKAFDVLKKEQEILDKMSEIIRVLKE